MILSTKINLSTLSNVLNLLKIRSKIIMPGWEKFE